MDADSHPSAVRQADPRFARFLYRWRWPLALLAVGFLGLAFTRGVGRVAAFSDQVASLADTSNGSGAVKPLFFDPSMDAWFGESDTAVAAYYGIERTFVAEDFVMVTFEEPNDPFGVFGRESLGTIARLTERFLTVPGVRHVRSLTYNPWIRWGTITDEAGDEEGLIISDLVEGDPAQLSDEAIIERMIATLGAERTAERIGAERVRAALGPDASFADFIGEPLLLGTILDATGTTTAIQVQVLRPRIDADRIDATFAGDVARAVGPNLSSIEQQRAVLRGIEHHLRVEQGLALPTPGRAELAAWIEGLEPGERRSKLQLELQDPNRNFMHGADGELVRKFYEYDPTSEGYADRTEPSDVVAAPADFTPEPRSPFNYKLGGLPLFERNFETVGIEDGKFVPLMFLVIILVLSLVFRRLSGVLIPLAVVFGSILAMVGVAFTGGDLLNNLTMMSPNMLTAVGIADAIHLFAAWVLLRGRYDDKQSLIVEVVRRNALPVFLTSLTTAVGFYSLTVSKLVPVQMLGSMAALGTLFAWALSMTLVPALLSLIPHRSKGANPQTAGAAPSRLERLFSQARAERFIDAVLRFRGAIVATTVLLIAVAGFGLSRVQVDSDFRGMFPDSNPTMSSFQWIEDRLGGVGDLELVFTGPAVPAAPSAQEDQRRSELMLRRAAQASPNSSAAEELRPLNPEERDELAQLEAAQAKWNTARIGVSTDFLRTLEAFEARLRDEMAQPDSKLAVITDLLSPLDTLRKIHQVQQQGSASAYRVPGEDDVPADLRQASLEYDEWSEEWSLTPPQSASTLVAQYYLQYESGARPGEALWTQLSPDRIQLRMQGRVVQDSSIKHLEAFERIEAIARTEFPELRPTTHLADDAPPSADPDAGVLADMTLSGKTLLFARTSDLFSRGFVQSMTLALTVITLLIGIIFRSMRLALVSMIPNVLPIILPLSVFGLLNVPLDGPAILVSSVALGVCVDDTIHFLTKFARGRRAGLSARDALAHVLTEAGAAMTVTTVVLIIGFSTLLLSDFAPNFQMGALASLMIGLAWFADFVLTSAVLSFDSDATSVPAPTQASPALAAARD